MAETVKKTTVIERGGFSNYSKTIDRLVSECSYEQVPWADMVPDVAKREPYGPIGRWTITIEFTPED